ncbi:MAG TPA: NUDIX domain-containing protein [Paracoccaceae bacterium]
MTDRIKSERTEILSEQWGTLSRTRYDYLRRDGRWQEQVREVYDHGQAAATLLFSRERDSVVLTRQFRLPAHRVLGEGHLLEVPAGLLEGDAPEVCARKEALEEAGISPSELEFVCRWFASPGSLTEMVHCYVGYFVDGDVQTQGGGLSEEGEDIEVVELGFEEAFAMIASGGIVDAKTIILLQHLALSRAG